MSTLYELSELQESLLNRLLWIEEEDSEHELITSALAKITGDVEAKLKFLSNVLVEAEAVYEARAEAARKAKRRAEIARNKHESVKNFMLNAMKDFGIKKIEGEHCSVTKTQGPKKLVYGEQFVLNDLPEFCVRVVPVKYEPIAKEVLALIESGEEIEGVAVVREEYLRVS